MDEAETKLIAKAAIFLIIAILGLIAGRGSRQIDASTRVLGYNRFVRGLSLLACFFPIGLLATIAYDPQSEDFNDLLIGLVISTPLVAFFFMEAFGTKIVLSQEGIGKETWYFRRKFFLWSEIASIYRSWDGSLVVRNREGVKFRMTDQRYMHPFDWLITACLEHLTSEQCPEWSTRKAV